MIFELNQLTVDGKFYLDGAQGFDPVFLDSPYQRDMAQAFLGVCFVPEVQPVNWQRHLSRCLIIQDSPLLVCHLILYFKIIISGRFTTFISLFPKITHPDKYSFCESPKHTKYRQLNKNRLPLDSESHGVDLIVIFQLCCESFLDLTISNRRAKIEEHSSIPASL